ncbi:hypothetical protein AMTRI_Chr13g117700 [Amborella trichopoda]
MKRLHRDNNITTGKIYRSAIDRERRRIGFNCYWWGCLGSSSLVNLFISSRGYTASWVLFRIHTQLEWESRREIELR